MKIISSSLMQCITDVHICELTSFQEISDDYWLTTLNIVWDIRNNRPCQISITNRGYPYIQLRAKIPGVHAKTILYHRLLSCARLGDTSSECVEHLDDDPLNCRLVNLLPSTQKRNVQRAFENNKRIISEAVFKVILRDNSIHYGTMRQLSEKLNIPRTTLYDRFYCGKFDPNRKYAQKKRISILSVEKIKDAIPVISKHRSIDYRKGSGNKFVLHLDDLDIVIT